MKFSLLGAFAVLTLSCLAALVYQQMLSNSALANERDALIAKISTYDSGLEQNVSRIRKSAAFSPRSTELHPTATAKFELAAKKLVENAKNFEVLAVTSLPSLNEAWGQEFLIFVPKGLQYSLDFDTFEDDVVSPFFTLQNRVECELPEGLTRLRVECKDDANLGYHRTTYSFFVNEKEVYSSLFAHQDFYAVPHFDPNIVEPEDGEVHSVITYGLMGWKQSAGANAQLKCRLKPVPAKQKTEEPR